MKQFVFLIIALPLLLINCTSDDTNPEDEFYHQQVTSTELESGNATYYNDSSRSATYYLVFKEGSLHSYEFRGNSNTFRYYDKYEIKGDSIYLTEKPFYEEIFGGETKYYALYIRKVHWGFDKKSEGGTGGTQILIRGDNAPPNFRTGYYNFL
jgi:hypothetical protein